MIYPKAETEREQYAERYFLAIERICGIRKELEENNSVVAKRMQDFFQKVSGFLLLVDEVYRIVDSGSLYELSLAELQKINRDLYRDILGDAYEQSYANPAYAREVLGEEYGKSLCLLYTEMRGNLVYAFEKRLFYLTTGAELFIEIYNLLEDDTTTWREVQRALYYYVSDYADITVLDRTESLLDASNSFAAALIQDSDLRDLRYLYYFGEYIGDNELKTAEFLGKMSQSRIEEMASTFTEGYRKGFELHHIDLSKKKTVNIRYHLGFERMIQKAMEQFRKMGLETTIYRVPGNLIHKNGQGISVGYSSTGANHQYDYDHRFDEAWLLDKAFAERKLAQLRYSYQENKTLAAAFAGPAVVEIFGESPFLPETKPQAASFSDKQKKIRLEYQSQASRLSNEYMPGDQVSFTIISYPVPEVGAGYEEIFQATMEVNNLDGKRYQKIQEEIIHSLDRGEYVTVTGRNGNHTKLTIALPLLEDREHQTNFENCVADVNIPLGEVFTSPCLKGTHGTLHVKEVYLNGLPYKDLTLVIEDGMIQTYNCTNFGTEKENRQYIEQNILFHHPTLPMGEFAIGTNTTAYAMGKRFGISHLLPILIAEKTGPHFAFGDTCFSHEEELVTHNPDGRQMMAKENDFSKLRHTQPEKAYFHCHTDVTIPYDELGDIVVGCREEGQEIFIIREGRFVLPGTEPLNEALDCCYSKKS
jgi:leucyl aminopeptidase (aminopeptidase T)